MNEIYINIESFKFSKRDIPFFENITFSLKSKDLNFLIGLSGMGKTTLLKIILGNFKEGNISNINFVSFSKSYNCNEVQKNGLIGYISQTPSLVAWETIKANIEIPFRLNKNLILPSETEIIEELNSVGLDKCILQLFPHQLSFGMQARISIVRALLYKPKFLFLDELFTGIDTINSNLIAKKLKLYVESNETVCLSITHDIDRAINFATNIFLLNRSRFLHQLEKPFVLNNIINIINNN